MLATARPTSLHEDTPVIVGKQVSAIRKWFSRVADEIQPVIVASNVAGITGGAIAAAGLITNRALQARSVRDA